MMVDQGSGNAGGEQSGGSTGGSAIHTERYTSWNGTLEGREAIIGHTILRGFKHSLSNKWVKVLVILMWFFVVFIPLLMGFLGMTSLVQSPDDDSVDRNDDDTYDALSEFKVRFPVSETIQDGEVAIYNISVSNNGEKPDTISVFNDYYSSPDFVNDNWSAGLFYSGSLGPVPGNGDWGEGNEPLGDLVFSLSAGEIATFHLVVMPPEGIVSGKGTLELVAESQGFFSVGSGHFDQDNFEGRTTIEAHTYIGHTEGAPYHFIMATETGPITSRSMKVGEEVSFPVRIINTGSAADQYNITVTTAAKWKYRLDGLDFIPDNPGDTNSMGRLGAYLQPGESRNFTVVYVSPEFPANVTLNYVTAHSASDNTVNGSVTTIVISLNIPDQDMTSELIQGLFNEPFMLFALFLAAVAGSRAISEDVAQKSFTIYFSRPIKKLDYVAIKFGTVGGVMWFGTMVPVLVTYAGLILLSSVGGAYLIEHLWVWGAIILYSLLVVLVLTSLILAFSSLTARRFYAAFGLVVSYIISTILSSIIQNDFDEKRGSVLSMYNSIQMVGAKLFDVPDVTYHYDWTYNLLMLVSIIVISTSVVILKTWKTELSE
jgi:hypothetical protein